MSDISTFGRMYPEHQSKGDRRKLRGNIRNMLGTSSDPAPSLINLARVVSALDSLMVKTTNGRFHVAVVDRSWGNVNQPRDFYRFVQDEGWSE